MCEPPETDRHVHTGIADSLKLTMADSQMHPYMHHIPVLSTLFYLKSNKMYTSCYFQKLISVLKSNKVSLICAL